MFDKDGDGRIQASELGNVMRMLGVPFTPESLQNMIANATGGKGDISSVYHIYMSLFTF